MKFDVRHVSSVSSTMDVATEFAHAGAPEGVVVCADEQSAGRGRRGRSWSSPPGAGLYASVILRPSHEAPHAIRTLSLITLTAGVALHDAIIRATGLDTTLKWPNDVMRRARKLAGILAEGLSIGSEEQAVVLGVGVNILRAAYPPDVADRATSLEAELGTIIDRQALLDVVLVALGARYEQLRAGNASDILRDWRAAAPSVDGAQVAWGEGRRGVTVGVDEQGALLVLTEGGIERVIAGELRWD